MKILRITTAYPVYIKKLYTQSVLSESEDYWTQYHKFCFQSYGWADFWSRAFGKLGYEFWEPVANVETLQKKWAKENGYQFDEKNWLLDIQTAQIKKFKPDILFVNDYSTYNYNYITELREKVPSIKYVVGWCGAPYPDEKVFRAYDLLFTNLPVHYEYFTEQGLHCRMLRHSFDPVVLERMGTVNKGNEISFLGSVVVGKGFHNERVSFLEFLLENTDLVLYSDLNPSDYKVYKEIKRKALMNKLTDTFFPENIGVLQSISRKIKSNYDLNSNYKKIYDSFHPEILVRNAMPGVFGLDMFRTLAESGITLNQHIDISKGSSNNMRLYEATGVGTCLVTDWSEDLKEKFDDGEEIVSYKSKPELLDKLMYLRKNPKTAEAIGKKGQERTLKENTFDRRAEFINEIIKSKI